MADTKDPDIVAINGAPLIDDLFQIALELTKRHMQKAGCEDPPDTMIYTLAHAALHGAAELAWGLALCNGVPERLVEGVKASFTTATRLHMMECMTNVGNRQRTREDKIDDKVDPQSN